MSNFVNQKNATLIQDATKKVMSGGEGVVWHVKDVNKYYPFRVVTKVYHQPPNSEQKAKLRTMIQLPMAQRNVLLQIAAWPIDAAFDAGSKAMVGYVMPLANDHKDVHFLYATKDRRKHFPQADWSFLICTAMNVARAFAEVHRFGHVAGDINHSNILIGSDARALLIDTDSFQISTGGKTFKCKVGVAEFLPPELFHKDLKTITRNANHDNFSVAVMIFLILCNGWHPFSGQDKGAKNLSLNEAVERNLYAFSKTASSKGILPPSDRMTIHPSDLPNEVAELFERAFDPKSNRGGRPTAAEWAKTIQHAFLGSLQACGKDAKHHFVKGKPCPWCRLEAKRSTPIFGASSVSPRVKPTMPSPSQTSQQTHPAAHVIQKNQTYVAPTPTAASQKIQQPTHTAAFSNSPWFGFSGTIGGAAYFFRQLAAAIAVIVIVIVTLETKEPSLLIFTLIAAWLNLSSTAQRLRSLNWSPFLCIGVAVPYFNMLLIALLFFLPRKQ